MARPMQFNRTGSPKEDIVAKLMRTAFLIGLAATWRPGAAAAQYSWSNLSVSVGLGTGSARLGIGASYTAVDPLYDVYFEDPCWDYAYYEWYRHACHPGYDRIHVRHNYSVVSVNPYYRPRRRHYYWPYGYSSYTHFSLSFGVNYGYGYAPFYPAYGYPGYGYPAYGQPAYGYPPYGDPAYGVVRYGGNRRASAVIRPAPAYRGSPLLRSSPLYKESPQAGAQRIAAVRSVASGRPTATRSITDRRARASSALSSVRDRAAAQPQRRATSVAAPSRAQAPRGPSGVAGARSARARPSDAVLRGATVRTDGLSARRGNSTRLTPPSQATTRRPSTSINREPRNTTKQSAPTSGAARSRPEAVTRSRALRERAPAPQSTPDARPRTSSRPQANTASPSRGRATRPSAAPRAAAPRATAPRATAPRATAPRATAPRARASSGRAPRGAASTRAAPTRSRSMQRPRR